MKDKNIHILSTGILEDALVKKAREQKVILDSISFIQTKNIIDPYTSAEIKALSSMPVTAVFTSTNGAEAVINSLHTQALQPKWNVYCIGAATQALIKKYFVPGTIKGIGKNAIELSESILKDNVKEVIFFCGNLRRDELPEYLQKNEIEVKEIVVYETNEIPIKIDKVYKGILFFSPSAVKSFFSVNSIPADTILFSIGNTTADAIRKISDNKIITSGFPSKNKLAALAISYFDKTNKLND